MGQNETYLDDLFLGLQTSFDSATATEKRRLAAQIYPWVEQQVRSLGDPPPDENNNITTNEQNYSSPTIPGVNQTFNQPDILFRELNNLAEREIDLNQIAGNIEQVIWFREIRSGRMLYVSQAFETVWGRSCASLYEDPLTLIESIHPEDRVQVMVARPRSDNKPLNQAYRILRPDGSLRWIFARSFLISGETNEPYCQFCIAQDITDRKQIELALRKTLDRTREQFDLSRKMSLAHKPEVVLKTLMSAHELRSARRATLLFFENPKIGPARGVDLIAAWSPNSSLPSWGFESNLYEEPAFLKLFQPKQTVVISKIDTDPRLPLLVREFLQEGQIQTLVIFPLVASGDWLGCLLVYYTQEKHFDNVELRHLKVLVDQTTITLYNLQLLEVAEESRHEAERANEIKTEFLAMISHELRTPLTSIIGFTTTLMAEDVVWEPEEQRDFTQTIQQEAFRLQELIDHLLILSRLEAGMLPILAEPCSLKDIIKDALPQLQTLTLGKTLAMHLPANLPQIQVDPKRVAQVLVNLVRNASTYSPEESEISISANLRGAFVQINVTDQGPGIPATEHKKVFKAFQRGVNVENRAGQGAGLGLAICKGLVEAHGGRIWIKKKNTLGATLSFTLPIVSPQNPASPADWEG
jgi:PAS domain S-box-containing protein